MLFAIFTIIIVIALFLPSLWVRYVMNKHSANLDQMPGTGGELATHLIDQLSLTGCKVELTEQGNDHFDPQQNVVRLSPTNMNGKSLTAVAVAAHEVGHAIQFNRKEAISKLRGRYLPVALGLKKLGIVLLSVMPILVLLLKNPAILYGLIAISLALQLIGALAYLIILPEDWDASFNKALPLLNDGGYLPDVYQSQVKQVLKAAALTYFFAALADIVNIGRWWLLLRR
ncbi:MAG: zinc metallopeptidase [Kangiellaceae bacterium]|jgi:Zn-dependent membrane protease YugP|nr:zinc metallopeptidase [Kangiellaceae bacterium]